MCLGLVLLFANACNGTNSYRGTGFKCEHVIIASCDFGPSTQLLERNVYITHSINQYVARA